MVSAAVVLGIRVNTRATSKAAQVTTGPEPRARLCKNCGHREVMHGDRAIGGICATRQYPLSCPCPEFVFWDRDAEDLERIKRKEEDAA